MERFPDLMPVIISSMGPTQPRLQQLPTWTEPRLCATLEHLLSNGLEKHRLCIFIDGLDEFDGDYNILLDLVRNLRQSTKVKFCLSSRPYRAFEDEFGSSAMLKLQDLTEPDIRKYVSDKLDQTPPGALQLAYSSFRLKDTVDTIVEKAEGVFLWVNLAVRDQLEGIRNGDDAEQLRERLELLPEEIEELYCQMVQKIDKVYRKEVAHYLQLVLLIGSPSLFGIALAVHKRIDDIVLVSPDIAVSDIRNHCRSTRARITTTCKGFLEVQEDVDLHEWQKFVNGPSSKADYSEERKFSKLLEDRNAPLDQREDLIETKFYTIRTRVDFLHRTAVDFFKDNEQGKGFLKINAPMNPHPRISYVKATLAGLMVFPVPTEGYDVRETIQKIMGGACKAEAETGVAQVALMDLVDRSLAMLCERSTGQPSNLHWCRAWGFPEIFGSSPLKSKFQHNGELKDDGVLTPYPVDFLGFVAWSGLHKYVEHTLDSQSGRQNPTILDHLVSCAVNGLGGNYYESVPESYMKLISALLKRGANPNMEIVGGSMWGSFLRKLYLVWYRHEFGWLWYEDGNILEVRDTWWLGIVQEFLRCGANVNEEVCLNMDNHLLEVVAHSVSSIPLRLGGYQISLQISALSILQHRFANAPNFSEIEDACTASGALSYFECTNISFQVVKSWGDLRWVDTKLSKQQVIRFSQALDEHLRACAGDPLKQHQIYKRLVVALFQELDMEQLYEQACREDDMDGDDGGDDESLQDEGSTTSAISTTPEEGHSHPAPTPQTETLPLRTKHDD